MNDLIEDATAELRASFIRSKDACDATCAAFLRIHAA